MNTKEADPHGGPLREYSSRAYQPLCATLAEARDKIDQLDEAIVRLIAERAMYVKDAVRFKRDATQVHAPARQAEVFEKVQRLARNHNRGFNNLEQVVDATYRAMVAAFIAQAQSYLDATELLDDGPA